MKIFGTLCLIAGIIWGISAYQMETSVYVPSDRISLSGPIEPGRNVENIGLIAAQQKNLICAGVLVISGILLFGFGALGEAIRQEKLDVITKPRDQNSELL